MKLEWRRHPGYGNTKDSHVVGGGSFLATLMIEAVQPGPVSMLMVWARSEKRLLRRARVMLTEWEQKHRCSDGEALLTSLPIT